jgi:hypothetical protein
MDIVYSRRHIKGGHVEEMRFGIDSRLTESTGIYSIPIVNVTQTAYCQVDKLRMSVNLHGPSVDLKCGGHIARELRRDMNLQTCG